MPSALFVSPHLDDVAFSCAGTAIRLVQEGWDVTIATVFTRSVPNPEGFALACQLDKGLSEDVDYMALRRAEDREFCRRAGLCEPVHLNLPDAPHRGYTSAPDLFAGVHGDDEVWRQISLPAADVVFGPQGLGNHADHLQVRRTLPGNCMLYQDSPYAIRNRARSPIVVDTEEVHERKLWAIEAYLTQVPFQFGSVAAMKRSLGAWEERFQATDEALLRQWFGFVSRPPEDSRAAS